MPRKAKELGSLDIKRLKHPGGTEAPHRFAVGGIAGLHMQVTASGAKSWLLRYTIGGRRRELGLGSYPEVGLAEAHSRAREAKVQVREGTDPIEARQAARLATIADPAATKTAE